ncbi:hypothetical protein C7459_105154 [Tumebacillus permanentifrigoris]|uniref:Uncharacterized protein n=1 Tax=Tumebacillus permanentifrigoris TaxID=378543 RepID=A0A316DEK1_9BACL|nr:hypothetical protein C7459_105154 [Tumebacillus permanentifrigoris]
MKKVVLSLVGAALLAIGFVSVKGAHSSTVAVDDYPNPLGVSKVAFDIWPDPLIVTKSTNV